MSRSRILAALLVGALAAGAARPLVTQAEGAIAGQARVDDFRVLLIAKRAAHRLLREQTPGLASP